MVREGHKHATKLLFPSILEYLLLNLMMSENTFLSSMRRYVVNWYIHSFKHLVTHIIFLFDSTLIATLCFESLTRVASNTFPNPPDPSTLEEITYLQWY